MSQVARKAVFGFLTSCAVQPQKKARGLKIQRKKVEEFYYLCNEKKGTDQLCSYCAADLHVCFHICKKQVFS